MEYLLAVTSAVRGDNSRQSKPEPCNTDATRVQLARAAKRALDVLGAATASVLTLPIQLGAATAILIEDGPPVLYRQARVGRSGKPFTLLKFRSMKANNLPPASVGQVRFNHPMVTRTGRAMRRLKIDELPQLVNILTGDMSLVGPRPALPRQVASYNASERRRLCVRPGLTGWAQVNGNVELSWSERILLDLWYIDHWSLRLDAHILGRTIVTILRGERRNDETLLKARDYAERTSWRS